jgi:hypothetical protein
MVWAAATPAAKTPRRGWLSPVSMRVVLPSFSPSVLPCCLTIGTHLVVVGALVPARVPRVLVCRGRVRGTKPVGLLPFAVGDDFESASPADLTSTLPMRGTVISESSRAPCLDVRPLQVGWSEAGADIKAEGVIGQHCRLRAQLSSRQWIGGYQRGRSRPCCEVDNLKFGAPNQIDGPKVGPPRTPHFHGEVAGPQVRAGAAREVLACEGESRRLLVRRAKHPGAMIGLRASRKHRTYPTAGAFQ